MAPEVGWGKWKRNAYLILEKYFHMGKVSQMSDVAHEPLALMSCCFVGCFNWKIL
jgi:hypothetical protein